MTLTEFIEKYNGKYIDYDGAYGPQCVDLARQYVWEVLDFPSSSLKPVYGAKDFYEKFGTIADENYYTKIVNTPLAIPEEGDIMIWVSGTYGHVAVYFNGDVNRFQSFDQNYPLDTPCHIQNHNYTSVAGWLRPKKDESGIQKKLDDCRFDRDENHDDRMIAYEELGFTGTFNRTVMVEEIRKLKNIDKDVVKKDEQLKEANDKIDSLGEKMKALNKKLLDERIKSQTDKDAYDDAVKKYNEDYDDAQKKYSLLQTKFNNALEALETLRADLKIDLSNNWRLLGKIIKNIFNR